MSFAQGWDNPTAWASRRRIGPGPARKGSARADACYPRPIAIGSRSQGNLARLSVGIVTPMGIYTQVCF